jgi:hypothetical protein
LQEIKLIGPSFLQKKMLVEPRKHPQNKGAHDTSQTTTQKGPKWSKRLRRSNRNWIGAIPCGHERIIGNSLGKREGWVRANWLLLSIVMPFAFMSAAVAETDRFFARAFAKAEPLRKNMLLCFDDAAIKFAVQTCAPAETVVEAAYGASDAIEQNMWPP